LHQGKNRTGASPLTWIYANNLFREHLTGAHPESPARLVSIERNLAENGLLAKCNQGNFTAVAFAELAKTHATGQIAAAKELAAHGGGHLDPDTVLSRNSFDIALQAAGAATAAVDAVCSGNAANALCLIRPPGHHATQVRSMGFCLFNNIAVAANHAMSQHGVQRVLIVDWDVHHGNGTQDIFYEVENVVFFSIHRYPFYPGSGDASETGTGSGLGATINVPVAFGTSRSTYLDLFRKGLHRAAARARPDLVLISAGFDAHSADPVGNLGLASTDFATLTREVQAVANTYCRGRIVSCLEGGYNLSALAESVREHLEALQDQPN